MTTPNDFIKVPPRFAGMTFEQIAQAIIKEDASRRAAKAGAVGGKSSSEKKRAANRINAQKAGRREGSKDSYCRARPVRQKPPATVAAEGGAAPTASSPSITEQSLEKLPTRSLRGGNSL